MSPWFPFDLTHAPDELRLGFFTNAERSANGGSNPEIDSLWNIFDHLGTCIQSDADLLTASGRPHISPEASIHPSVIIDTSAGPVIIGPGVRVEPFAFLRGPVAICQDSIIRAGARLYGPVVIGPVCKIGGEIEDSVVHGYSNKQHDGFLGHSWIGEWCNLGAGTTTSDLKNTYGEVSLDLPSGRVSTGRTFLGSLIGDHSRTAIGTCLMAGTICGIFVNMASPLFPPKYLPSFTWDIDSSIPYDLQKAIEVARIVMQRRNRVLDQPLIECYERIAALRLD
jgi:UDP-N-acetylglucosamine diphosphorylase/glucosamine-1-phosphate N-acetyltransferase